MVSADNLNLDVLALIFEHLAGQDLVSVASVSTSFHAAVVPRLYSYLYYRLRQAKKWPPSLTPFAVVLAHPEFATHVQEFEIRRLPTINERPRPDFLCDAQRALALCTNLRRFTFTSQADVFGGFLRPLQALSGLEELRLCARCTPAQATMLAGVRGRLRALALEQASVATLAALPAWASALAPRLRSLTIFAAHDLNEAVLVPVLAALPALTGLHIIQCPRVDHTAVLRLTAHTPQLESLAFTTWEHPRAIVAPVGPLAHLQNFVVDTQASVSQSHTSTLWMDLLERTRGWGCPLRRLVLRQTSRGPAGGGALTDAFVRLLVAAHGRTLESATFDRTGALTVSNVRVLVTGAPGLRSLTLAVPPREINEFGLALRNARALEELVDTGSEHSHASTHAGLSRENVQLLMACAPRLRTVHTVNREWTGVVRPRPPGVVRLPVEAFPKRREPDERRPWYMPDGEIYAG